MSKRYFVAGLLLALPAAAQDLTNSAITVQAGTILYVGTGSFSNQSGTLTNAGALRVDGPLANPGTLDLNASGWKPSALRSGRAGMW